MGDLKNKARHYSYAFDGASPLADETIRTHKAAKIRAVLENERALPDRNVRVLDIGCSHGLILERLVSDGNYGVGVDFDLSTLQKSGVGVALVCADAERLPFAAETFDVVVCNHVYEHTDDPARMFGEIRRILVTGGLCYFAGPNKYDFIEPHYRLPFLSWLPSRLADRYVRVAGRGDRYLERPRSYRALKRLVAGFEARDYTYEIVADPVRFRATDVLRQGSLKQVVAKLVLKFAPVLFPGFIWVLRKPVGAPAAAGRPGSAAGR